MLELLTKYAREQGIDTTPGFKSKDVRWAIACDEHGKFLEVLELGDASEKKNQGQTFSMCPELTQPEMIAGGVTKSSFLVDSAEIVALYGDNANSDKVKAKHGYFVKLLRDASSELPLLKKAAVLLDDPKKLLQIQKRLEELKVKPNEKITLKLGAEFPIESNVWHDWWQQFRKNLSLEKPTKKTPKEDDTATMRCFVTGEMVKPLATHPKIEKLSDVGGIPTGDVLIGFDKDAFRSYGLEQSANAAVSEESASSYRAALNYLIKKHGKRLAGAKVVYWFKKKVLEKDNPLSWLEEGAEAQKLEARHVAEDLLKSIEAGKRPDLGKNYYYGITLSGASGRVMVRDWIEGQFEELVRNVVRWFDDLSIIHREGKVPAPDPKFLAVLGGIVRELDDLPAPFVSKMWLVAVRGEPIPQFAMAQALSRVKVDIIKGESFNHARLGLIKAYHIRNSQIKGGNLKPYLNEEHPQPAYHCGRLMAVLAKLQNSALGDVGAGVVQRYYAAASATPALVLGRLTRTSQFHLNKLDPGLAHWFEDKIAGIWGKIKDTLPPTLNLEEQSLFALGYYQQLADLRTKKSDKQEEADNV